jgi:hypothetical protein
MEDGDEEREREQSERRRLEFEFFKHLTTLDTAFILLLLTLIEKYLPAKHRSGIEWAFVGFGVSLLFSVVSMFFVTYMPRLDPYWQPKRFNISAWGFSLGIVGFFTGFIVMTVVVGNSLSIWKR